MRPVLLICAADGAGSAALSHIGAAVACNAAMNYLRDSPMTGRNLTRTEEMVAAAIGWAGNCVRRAAEEEGETIRTLATTLTVAAVFPEYAVVGQVGDGLVALGDADSLEVAHWSEHEDGLNVTDFLQGDSKEAAKVITSVQGVFDRVACTSDGMIPVLFDTRERRPYPPMFDPLFEALEARPAGLSLDDALAGYLHDPDFDERTDDDKSLVLAVRSTSKLDEPADATTS